MAHTTTVIAQNKPIVRSERSADCQAVPPDPTGVGLGSKYLKDSNVVRTGVADTFTIAYWQLGISDGSFPRGIHDSVDGLAGNESFHSFMNTKPSWVVGTGEQGSSARLKQWSGPVTHDGASWIGNWHHVCMTWNGPSTGPLINDNNEMTVYLGGSDRTEGVFGGTWFDNGDGNHIGSHVDQPTQLTIGGLIQNQTRTVDSLIYRPAIWDIELDQTDVQALVSAHSQTDKLPTIGGWTSSQTYSQNAADHCIHFWPFSNEANRGADEGNLPPGLARRNMKPVGFTQNDDVFWSTDIPGFGDG